LLILSKSGWSHKPVHPANVQHFGKCPAQGHLHLQNHPTFGAPKPANIMYTQEELLEKIRPLLQREGAVYQKKKNVYARPASPGEVIRTVTKDGLETENRAEPGDFIVRNQTTAGEEYIVPGHKFPQKYTPLQTADEAWTEYRPTGQIVALELTPERLAELDMPDEFEFVASWGSAMIARAGDFLGGPDSLTEVYRLARQEFFETYQPD